LQFTLLRSDVARGHRRGACNATASPHRWRWTGGAAPPRPV